jgi:hypothetical protein
MQGTIVNYRADVGAGIIQAKNGDWYNFKKSEWRGLEPRLGMAVVFEAGKKTLLFLHAIDVKPENISSIAA